VRLSQKNKNKNKTAEVEEYLPRMLKVLVSMSNTATKKKKKIQGNVPLLPCKDT
jgi:hypothetical protein